MDSVLARAFPNCVTLDKFLPAPVTPNTVRVDEIMISKEALSPVNLETPYRGQRLLPTEHFCKDTTAEINTQGRSASADIIRQRTD